jgi:hypothetical protein
MRRYASTFVILPLLTAACAAPAPPPGTVVAPWQTPADAGTNLAEPILAPGAIGHEVTQQNILFTICTPGWAASVRPPASFTDRIKRAQIPLYGYPVGTNPRDFEEDHREPLELGGAPRDLSNLWPQPLDEAHAKDRLETAVKRDVCAGHITLEQGQAIFFGDFWDDYDRRFGARAMR